ncbi:hypothetical protein HYV81_04915 [Candidatus Woesearchaeota archaeon]|nr:hypothetical protein [Candidatus Woesearchaeota archaeon]
MSLITSSLQKIPAALKEFFMDEQFLDLFLLTLALTIAAFIIWFMYRQLSRRDLFKEPIVDHTTAEKGSLKRKLLYLVEYGTLFPILTFIWFLVFSACLYLLLDGYNLTDILLLSIVLISASRIAAYISQPFAEDLAKLLPLTLIATVILNPEFSAQLQLKNFSTFTAAIPQMAKYLVFTVFLELFLRMSHGIYAHLKNNKKDKK